MTSDFEGLDEAAALWPLAVGAERMVRHLYSDDCARAGDAIHDGVVHAFLRILDEPARVDNPRAYLAKAAKNAVYSHWDRCRVCRDGRAAALGDDEDGHGGEATPPWFRRRPDGPSEVFEKNEAVRAFEAAIDAEQEARPACPWHRGRLCWHAGFFSDQLNDLSSRAVVLKELRALIRADEGASDGYAQKCAKRRIACYDWWYYVGTSAVDTRRPMAGYEGDAELRHEWGSVEERTRAAIGDPRFDFLDHFKVDAHGEWVKAEYRKGGAVEVYTMRPDLRRVIDHQRPDVRRHLDVEGEDT